MKDIINVHNVSKSYGSVKALDNVTFHVQKGELFGFLGPNGAGKTTTINILTGLATADQGSITINGFDCIKKPRTAQHLIGVVPDESNLYPDLTGFENLCFCASLFGIGKKDRQERAESLLQSFDLLTAGNRKFGSYSKGMKRKLTIAAGIIHEPEILFLDEPTTGIDVASARQLRRLISDLHKQQTTIFLTTHYIEEAERLCDRIAFIVDGTIVKTERVTELLSPIKDQNILEITCSILSDDIMKILPESFPDFLFSKPQNNIIRIDSNLPINIAPLIRFLEDQKIKIYEAKRLRPSLEDVFVKITGIEVDKMKSDKQTRGHRR